MWPSMYFIFTVQIHGLKPISFPDLELMYRIQDLKYIGPCPAQYGRTRALFKAPPLWSGARAHWSTAHTTTAKPPLPFPSSWGWRMGGCLDGRGEEKYRAIYSLWLLLAWFFFFFLLLFPAGHLFPVCNMTPVPNWFFLLLKYVCEVRWALILAAGLMHFNHWCCFELAQKLETPLLSLVSSSLTSSVSNVMY